MSWFTNLFKRRRPHLRQYHVVLPDGTDRIFDLEARTTGSQLLEVSLLSMSVPSAHHDMFCIDSPILNQDDRRWLRLEKSLRKELKGLSQPVMLNIQVLFYPRDHHCVLHRVTKHLLYSQIKTDLKEGKLKYTGEVAAQLAGLVAQAELGNYSETTLQSSYMAQLHVIEMNPRRELQAIEQHKIRRGLRIEECIDEFISIAETLKGYGTQRFDVLDDQDRQVTLACGPLGIEVLMGNIQTIQIHWETIITMNVHHRMLNFQTESSYNQTGYTYSFQCSSSKRCKNIAVLCVSLRNHYCNSEVAHEPSRLRRIFSARLPHQRQRRGLHRNGSTISSTSSTPARHRHMLSNTSGSMYSRPLHHSAVSAPSLHSNHRHTSSESSITAPLTDLDKNSQSPTSPDSTSIQLLPTLEEIDHNQTPIHHGKSITLPARMDPLEIMNFSSPLSNGHIVHNNHIKRHNGVSGRRGHNHYHGHNGEIDNFDCINELLEEGLESVSHSRKKRSTVGDRTDGEGGRRVAMFPTNNHSHYSYRSQTMQYPKRHKEKYMYSNGTRPHHQYTNSDPSRHYLSATNLTRQSNNTGVATMAHQLSLATLSQDSGTSSFLDPHIRSLVFDCSQADDDTTEL